MSASSISSHSTTLVQQTSDTKPNARVSVNTNGNISNYSHNLVQAESEQIAPFSKKNTTQETISESFDNMVNNQQHKDVSSKNRAYSKSNGNNIRKSLDTGQSAASSEEKKTSNVSDSNGNNLTSHVAKPEHTSNGTEKITNQINKKGNTSTIKIKFMNILSIFKPRKDGFLDFEKDKPSVIIRRFAFIAVLSAIICCATITSTIYANFLYALPVIAVVIIAVYLLNYFGKLKMCNVP